MLTFVGDVVGGLGMMVNGQMAWQTSKGIFYLPRCFSHNLASKQATTGQPMGCPNASYRMS